MRSAVFIALCGLSFTARPAGAQTACDQLKSFFSKAPRIGDWADIRTDAGEGKEPSVSRVSFVGKEQRNGRDLYRMQMVSTAKGQRTVMQMLTPWDPSVMEEGQNYDSEVVMKMGDQPAMIMPMKADPKKEGLFDLRKACAEMKYVGEETVEVPAGSFKTQHYSGPEGDSWVSPDVPGWHMVKMVPKDGKPMVLIAVGTGAKNEITEKPVDMKAMMANPEAMKKMMESQKGESNK